MKKLLTLLALVMALGASACAETAVPLAENLYDDLYFLSDLREDDTVQIQHDSKIGVIALDGTVIIEPQYGSIRLADSDFPGLYVVANENGDNTLSLIDRSNTVLTKELYGVIDIISEDWFLGVVLKKTSGSDYDYSGYSDTKYKVSRYDVYYRPAGKVVGTLKRDQYARSEAFGEYLLVENDKGKVQLYDKNFKKVSSTFYSAINPEFMVNDQGEVVSNITGEKIASGYRYIYDITSEYFRVTTAGTYLYTIIDRSGNELIAPAKYSFGDDYVTDTAVYAEVTLDGLTGLYELRSQTFAVPIEYDKLIDINFGARITSHGYVCVEKDGMLGYVRDGAVTCPVSYAKADMTVLGCSMFSKDASGVYTLVAADGQATVLDGVTELSEYNSDPLGKYIAAKNADGLWGLIDWHGQWVLEATRTYADFHFLDATHFYSDTTIYEIR